MNPKTALRTILVIGVGGFLFSGYLSYNELFAACAVGCPVVPAPGGIFGLPACVYGFVMYAGVVVVAALGLRKR